MKSKIVGLALMLGLTPSTDAVTSKDVFPGKEDWVTLKGVPVRKGTINATGINIKNLDRLLAENGSAKDIQKIIEDQRAITLGLHATDYFDMQPVDIFLKDSARQGRIMIAVLALQVVPKLMTPAVRERLVVLTKTAHPVLKAEIDRALKMAS